MQSGESHAQQIRRSKAKVVLCKLPFVSLEKLEYEVVMSLIEETQSPSEWFSEFSVLARVVRTKIRWTRKD